jgi:hypothetical protein
MKMDDTQVIRVEWIPRPMSGRGQRLETQRIQRQVARRTGDMLFALLLLLLVFASLV